MKPSSMAYKTALMIAVGYKGLKEEIGKMSETISSRAPHKRPRVDDSEEEVIEQTPRKDKRTPGATPHQQATATATAQDISSPDPSRSEPLELASSSKAVRTKMYQMTMMRSTLWPQITLKKDS